MKNHDLEFSEYGRSLRFKPGWWIPAAIVAAALAVVAYATSPAAAQTKKDAEKPAAASTASLTILEVLNIGAALQQMGDYHDARGQLVAVPFKFDGSTLLTFAVNINAADGAKKAYQEAYTKFEKQELGDVSGLKPDELQAKKIALSQSDAATRMTSRPAGALMSRIKEADLCMKSPPVAPCTATNSIPPALLAAILPIVDR